MASDSTASLPFPFPIYAWLALLVALAALVALLVVQFWRAGGGYWPSRGARPPLLALMAGGRRPLGPAGGQVGTTTRDGKKAMRCARGRATGLRGPRLSYIHPEFSDQISQVRPISSIPFTLPKSAHQSAQFPHDFPIPSIILYSKYPISFMNSTGFPSSSENRLEKNRQRAESELASASFDFDFSDSGAFKILVISARLRYAATFYQARSRVSDSGELKKISAKFFPK